MSALSLPIRGLAALGLLAAGYLLAGFPVRIIDELNAAPDTLSPAVREKLRDTNRGMVETMQSLIEEHRYVPAIQGVNAFAVSVGGVDAIADLEAGDGVDPETFAGLYSGLALPEINEHLSHNAEGRLTYKNKVVRLYTPARLKKLFAFRASLAPVATAGTPRTPGGESDASKEKAKTE